MKLKIVTSFYAIITILSNADNMNFSIVGVVKKCCFVGA